MGKFRHAVQIGWTLITNSYITGFLQGKIYKGPLKHLCVPGLNCYSCPGALGSCPIGSLQAVMGSRKYTISLLLIGFFMMVGALCGRFVCGWLCPFGLFQDLLHKIPFVKKIKTFHGDRILRYLKYVILLVFVILMPLFVVDVVGQGSPWFCKLVCPSGTLLGGWPLVASNPGLQDAVGWLFAWKNVILIVTIILSILIYRPFCKYICPLGAIYAAFNKISLHRLTIDADKCTHCGLCSKTCKMGVEPHLNPKDMECIHCGDCVKACPCGAINMGFRKKTHIYNGKETASKNNNQKN